PGSEPRPRTPTPEPRPNPVTDPNPGNPDAPNTAADLEVLIIAKDEALNLPHSLKALQGWTQRVVVVDSGSTDGSVELAQSLGAEVVHHDWAGYAGQRNWALDHMGFSSAWTLILDADETITPKLRDQIIELTNQPVDAVPQVAFYVNRLPHFLGKPIRHCGFFPNWQLRLFKTGAGRYEERRVHEHLLVTGEKDYLHTPLLHHDRRPLHHYMAKHNDYSTLEAEQQFAEMFGEQSAQRTDHLTPDQKRRRWLKKTALRRLPVPGFFRFLYMYALKLGFLDGATGFRFCRFIGFYDTLVAMKLRELIARHQEQQAAPDGKP
ncbi:MAG: glycosyltransferase family 2 protein, partial [Planctomycetota bacterium]